MALAGQVSRVFHSFIQFFFDFSGDISAPSSCITKEIVYDFASPVASVVIWNRFECAHGVQVRDRSEVNFFPILSDKLGERGDWERGDIDLVHLGSVVRVFLNAREKRKKMKNNLTKIVFGRALALGLFDALFRDLDLFSNVAFTPPIVDHGRAALARVN